MRMNVCTVVLSACIFVTAEEFSAVLEHFKYWSCRSWRQCRLAVVFLQIMSSGSAIIVYVLLKSRWFRFTCGAIAAAFTWTSQVLCSNARSPVCRLSLPHGACGYESFNVWGIDQCERAHKVNFSHVAIYVTKREPTRYVRLCRGISQYVL